MDYTKHIVDASLADQISARNTNRLLKYGKEVRTCRCSPLVMPVKRMAGGFPNHTKFGTMHNLHHAQWARSPEKSLFNRKNNLIINSALKADSGSQKTALLNFGFTFSHMVDRMLTSTACYMKKLSFSLIISMSHHSLIHFPSINTSKPLPKVDFMSCLHSRYRFCKMRNPEQHF